jgi:hypothetical protein
MKVTEHKLKTPGKVWEQFPLHRYNQADMNELNLNITSSEQIESDVT